tara:strand:- start:38128 stop:38751 length:624 start_codon:yes stop_codon:yes gene_type:complete
MGFFSFMETSLYFTLGITFLLILLLVYHFKQRIMTAESKQDTMFEIINNLAQEIHNIKTTVALMNRPSTPYPHNLQNNFHTEINDEPEQESQEDDMEEYDSEIDEEEYDDEEDDEKVIVSDDEDNISVEELSLDNDVEDVSNKENKEETLVETSLEVEEKEQSVEKPDFSKMNLGSLKSYIIEQGWVQDASKMKKAQILSLIQERAE